MLCIGAPALSEQPRGESLSQLSSQLDQVATQIRNAEERLKLVETEYSQRELTNEELVNRRFAEAEIQYLLGNFSGALVLFYDLVGDPVFRPSAHYQDALFYLGDGLYQQQNYLSARVYLRQLLTLRAAHYRESLSRYLEIASRLNDFTGIDEFINQARSSTGQLPPELAYLYGKWLFKRTDLPPAEKAQRLSEVLRPLAEEPKGKFRLRSMYFLAVADVQREDYPAAVERFRSITQDKVDDEREAKVKELASLSIGRLLYELGKYDEAIDRYQDIPTKSEYFPESLYEIAWARVKRSEYALARNTTEILLLVAPNSTLTPEAQLLQGQLLLKLGRYGEATDAYRGVIQTYGPVRDRIDSLLSVSQDPVAYFDSLLAKSERAFDVSSLLPPIAQKWATSEQEVADAIRMVNDLHAGEQGVGEAEQLANHLLKTIDERGLNIFPALQEGYTRADLVDGSLALLEKSLVGIESNLAESALTPEERAKLARLREGQADLARRFGSLPANEEEAMARRKKMQARLEEDDKDLFQLGFQIQSMLAETAAIRKWVRDTENERSTNPEDAKAFKQKLAEQEEAIGALQKELADLRQTISEEKFLVDSFYRGEESLRSQFRSELEREHQMLAPAESKLPTGPAELIYRAHTLRSRVSELEHRVTAAKNNIRQQVAARAKEIRDKIAAEQSSLADYRGEVGVASKDTGRVVGRIAYGSFKRLRPQFQDLVLKADVGVVDVAFTRKQDKTNEIQKISFQKDHDLQALERDFKEVLKDVD